MAEERFAPNPLSDEDRSRSRLKPLTHSSIPRPGSDDSEDGWSSDPLFDPAKQLAHWLMYAEVAGQVLVVPIAPSRTGDPARCRPIGCYQASPGLASDYRRDR